MFVQSVHHSQAPHRQIQTSSMNDTTGKAQQFIEDNMFSFTIEKSFSVKQHLWMCEKWHWFVCISFSYLVAVAVGKQYMKSRPPYSARSALFAWNVFLAIYSILGFSRTVVELIFVLIDYGFDGSICETLTSEMNPSVSFWYYMFLWSKVIELGDTAFLILRKRKLVFLHWYHHSSTIIASWYVASLKLAISRWFVVLNYGVHSLMYTYYAIRVFYKKVPLSISMTITSLQIIQTIMACYAIWRAFLIDTTKQSCHLSKWGLTVSCLHIVPHMFMFIRLFYLSYVLPRIRSAKASFKVD